MKSHYRDKDDGWNLFKNLLGGYKFGHGDGQRPRLPRAGPIAEWGKDLFSYHSQVLVEECSFLGLTESKRFVFDFLSISSFL